ncbi:MAG: Cna B-type domain-containing protein, partial [Erysipelotrichaceae bacterium]
WDDAENQDGKRPAEITINLYKQVGEAEPTLVESKTVKAKDDWSCSFTELPKYEGGVEIKYTVTEDKVEGYDDPEYSSGENNTLFVTNCHEPAVIEIFGTKTWEDEDNVYDTRPDSITIRLWADGKEIASKEVTEKDGWSWSFKGFPKFKDGKEIKYTVTEDAVSGYTSEITGDQASGYVVTNTYTPVPPTGDNFKPMIWITVMIISLILIVILNVYKNEYIKKLYMKI